MSNATIGSYTAGEWGRIQADARRYLDLRNKYGSLRAAQKEGIDTKNTKSGLSLSNAYHTNRIMREGGKGEYKLVRNKNGTYREGKETSFSRNSTLSARVVKKGTGQTFNNKQAAGGAKTIQSKNRAKSYAQQRHSRAIAKNLKPSTTSGSKSGKTSSTRTTTKSKTTSKPKPKYNGAIKKDATNKYYSRKTHRYYPSSASKKRAESKKRR